MAGVLRALLLLAPLAGAIGCGTGVCDDYGHEPRFDESSRPPSAAVLGRATWTVLHTTAAYLPDTLTDVQAEKFGDVVRGVGTLYPGEGGELFASILKSPTVVDELKGVKAAADAQLLVWKLHNMVTAAVVPDSAPFPASAGLPASRFSLEAPLPLRLSTIDDITRAHILDGVKARWVRSGGLEVEHMTERDLLNLPPDRTMLGRAYWTYIHTASVYLPHSPSPVQLEAFRQLFDAIYEIFPCPVCRGHFRLFYHDARLQAEIAQMKSKHGVMLVCWKLHNIVSADGVKRGEWDKTRLFPKESHLHTSSFLIPSPDGGDAGQLSLNPCPDKGNTTRTCLSSDDGFGVLSDVQGRWQIEGGIDQPLVDRSPQACAPPRDDQKVLRMDVFVMAKCPWCAKSMEKIADTIKCDYSCELDGETLEARLDFQLHMVGLNNGTYAEPWLRAIHGPSELVGERLELCAREHYPRDYQYMEFIHCMDKNVTTVPLEAPECAHRAGMDLDVLVACANLDGERLVAGSYGYSSWMGIDITPTFVLNGKKKLSGLPKNFSDVVCDQIRTTSKTAAQMRLAAADGDGESSDGPGPSAPVPPVPGQLTADGRQLQKDDLSAVEKGTVLCAAALVVGLPFWLVLRVRRASRGERAALLGA